MLKDHVSPFHKTLMIILALVLAGVVYLATIDTIAYLDNTDADLLGGLIKHKKTVNTTDWKTFSASGYNYSFKYPSNWTATPSIYNNDFKLVTLTDPDGNKYQWSYPAMATGAEGCSILDRKTKNIKSNTSDISFTSETGTFTCENTTVDAKNKLYNASTEFDAGGKYENNFLFTNWVLRLGEPSGGLDNGMQTELTQSEIDTLDVIVASFSYVSTTPTTSWKTYTNSTYGFNFKYPKNWKVSLSPEENNGEAEIAAGAFIPVLDVSNKTSDGYSEKGEAIIEFTYYPNSTASQLTDQWIGVNYPIKASASIKNLTKSTTQILGKEAKIIRHNNINPIEGLPYVDKVTFFSLNNKIMKVVFITPTPDSSNLEDIYDSLMGTILEK